MASLLDVLIFDAVYGSWILSLPSFTLGITLYLEDFNVTLSAFHNIKICDIINHVGFCLLHAPVKL